MERATLQLSVSAEAEGTRLDRFLSAQVPDKTRSALRRLILDGHVLVDGKRAAKPGLALRAGMLLAVTFPEPPPDAPLPESIPIEILYEDEHLAVVEKPAGIVVHRGHGRDSGTLVNALLGRGVPLAPAGGVERPGIVHRLDEGTSGLMVVAKRDDAFHALRKAWLDQLVRKTYLALVWGHPNPDSGRISRGIGRSRTNPTKMTTEGARGRVRPALTVFRTRETVQGFAVLELDLHTGRTHQIRVHLQSIHHPVVGDERYGGRAWRGVLDPLKRKALREFSRLALHASMLSFPHPADGKQRRFDSPLPAELESLLEVLRDGA